MRSSCVYSNEALAFWHEAIISLTESQEYHGNPMEEKKKKRKKKRYEKQLEEWQKTRGPHQYSTVPLDGGPGIPIGSVDTKTGRSVRVTFDCPACEASDITALVFERSFVGKLFFVIPLFGSRSVFIKCAKCGKEYKSNSPLKDLLTGDKDYIRQSFHYRGKWDNENNKYLAPILLLSILPFVGLTYLFIIGSKICCEDQKCWQSQLVGAATLFSLLSTTVGVVYLLIKIFDCLR